MKVEEAAVVGLDAGGARNRVGRRAGFQVCLIAMVAAAGSTTASATPTITGAVAAAARLAGACAPYPGGTTVCSGEVPSFDGSPLDVDVTLPMGDTGAEHPLIVLLHGFGNDKHEWESTTDSADGADKYHWNTHWFAAHGFYVLTYTARGFRDSGPSAAWQPGTPAGTGPGCLPPGGSACPPSGTIRVKNNDVEIRDTQWLAALTAQAFPAVTPDNVTVSGGSYGGGESWLQAAAQAERPYWADFPGLPWLRLAAAVPKYPWTDLAYSLAPNGHPGGPSKVPAGQPYQGSDLYSSAQGAPGSRGVGNPFGAAKASYISALNALGTANGVFDEGSTTPQRNGPEPYSAWLARVDAGEPYDTPGRADDPIVAAIRDAFSAFHSAYYQPGWPIGAATGREPAVLSISGWTDDLFPPVESFRMFNYLKRLDPHWPVSVIVGDVGHPRAQNPPSVWRAVNAQAWAFVRTAIAGGQPPASAVSSFPTRCDSAATAADELSAPTPATLAGARLEVGFDGTAVLTPSAGAGDPDGPATDAVAGALASDVANPAADWPSCRASGRPSLDSRVAGGYTALSNPLPEQRTSVGIGQISARYAALPPQPTAVLTARIWDVAPDGTAVLVSRGVYRFDFNGYDPTSGTVRLPLYGNHWAFPAGHRIRLDLAQVDQATYRPPNSAATATLTVSGPRLVLPVREASSIPTGSS